MAYGFILHFLEKKDNYAMNKTGPNSFLEYSLLKPKSPSLLTFIQEVYCYQNISLHTRNGAMGIGHFSLLTRI